MLKNAAGIPPKEGSSNPLLSAGLKKKSVTNARIFGLDSALLRHLLRSGKHADSVADFQGTAVIFPVSMQEFPGKKRHSKPCRDIGYLQEACLTKLTNGIGFFQNKTTLIGR